MSGTEIANKYCVRKRDPSIEARLVEKRIALTRLVPTGTQSSTNTRKNNIMLRSVIARMRMAENTCKTRPQHLTSVGRKEILTGPCKVGYDLQGLASANEGVATAESDISGLGGGLPNARLTRTSKVYA